jgi:2,3-bisphosphoglycerate-independent phosphoglycerate mutase
MTTDLKARKAVLVILDGFGLNPETQHNAVAQASAPTLSSLLKSAPQSVLDASESHVGLPTGFMGNSEVGHLNIGAGRVVYQDFSLISHAIEEGSFFTNPVFLDLFAKMKAVKGKPTLHLMGLVSDGGVHSHLSHLFALVQLAIKQGIRQIAVHVFTDGRDTSPTSGMAFVSRLNTFLKDAGAGEIATIHGRFYAMDRDNRWERTETAFNALVSAKSPYHFSDPLQCIQSFYDERITDEFIPPAVSETYRGMHDGDGILFFNFRADRARQITRAFTQTEFTHFKREGLPTLAGYVMMTPYDESFTVPYAYGKPKVENTIGEYVSKLGWKQLRIAETEKYAHVTYFFNGGAEKVFEGEKRVLVPSPREVRTYDLKPEMSAVQVTDQLLAEVKATPYQFVVVNFANCDMVGHTGNLPAAISAVETVDKCLKRILDWAESENAFVVITADHGNCEKMQDDDGQPLTSHTLLPVPFIVVDTSRKSLRLLPSGKLCDIAPTIIDLWGQKPPREMTGKSLLAH